MRSSPPKQRLAVAVCLPVHDDAQPLPAAIWHIRKMRHCRQAAPPYRLRYDACASALFRRRRSHAPPFCGSFHRLTSNNGGAGFGMAALALPRLPAQSIVALLPNARPPPGAVVVKDAAIRRHIVGQHTPGGAGVPDLVRRIQRMALTIARRGYWTWRPPG